MGDNIILLTLVEISKSGLAPSNNLIIAVFPFSTAIYNAVFRSCNFNNKLNYFDEIYN